MPLHALDGSIPDAQFSLPPYLLADFPLYLALGAACARHRAARAAILTGSVLLSLLLALLQAGAMNIA